jgi:hypothetical protein
MLDFLSEADHNLLKIRPLNKRNTYTLINNLISTRRGSTGKEW